jgi:hypothetical protein
MSNELLPLLDILAGPPKNADHEETFAIAVNGSGDGSLPHDLNPDPSTDPSLDPSLDPSPDPNLRPSLHPSPHSYPQANGAATTANHRAAAADDSPAPAPTGLADGLARVAATIRQIESVLKANGALALEVHFAIERIQDVAMALRMREVDTALCDTLEASIREVGDAIVRNDAAAARTQSAAALLCDLGKRIDRMLPPVSIVAVEPDKADRAADLDRPDGAAKPHKADGVAKPDKADGVNKPASVAMSLAVGGDHPTKPNGAAAGPNAAAVDVVVSDDHHGHPLPQPAFVHPALPDMQLSGEAKQQTVRSLQPVVLSMPSPVGENEDAPLDDRPVDRKAEEREAQAAAEQIAVEPPAAASHDAERAAPATTASATFVATSTPSAAETEGAAPSADESNAAAAANSRALVNDPLAAIYGLSEEELIALFS